MKKWVKNQEKLKKLSQKTKEWLLIVKNKIQGHPFYQSIQSRIGKKRMYWLNMGIILFVPLIALTHCGRGGDETKHNVKPPIPVLTSKIRKTDVPIYLNAVGTVTPIETITIKTQINGKILKVHFNEGQIVKKGQLLVEIDPLPYEALLKQYEGQLARDQALLANAHLDLIRYKKLYAQDSISQQTLETQIHLVEQYEGNVLSDQGLVDSAKASRDYCRIMSGISGMVGFQQVNTGNFVQTTDATPITIVNQLSPIAVVFSIPEDDLGQIQEKISRGVHLVADAFDRKEDKILATGRLLAIDNQIDNTTGTIKFKAKFENEDRRLFPNQFVNIRLKVDTLKDVLVVPTAAIQRGRQGPFVYVVDEEKKSISVKVVTVRTSVNGESTLSGDVKAGETVVIQGTDKLSEGSTVTISQGDNASLKGQAPR
jgi:multidrug efflux system membrane fusion protein